jgi:flagellar biosynthesis protein FlhB
MSERPRDDATEPPSPRKQRRAREQGDLPLSREVAGLAAGAGALLAVWLAAPEQLGGLARLLGRALSGEPADWAAALGWLARATALVGGTALAAAGLAGGLQAGLRFRLRPSLARLSPWKGFGRLFSRQRLADLGLMALRLGVLGAAALLAVWRPLSEGLGAALRAGPGGGLVLLGELLLRLAGACLVAGLPLAALDVWVQRRRWRARLRMTRQEVRRETREQEGDPHLRAERRRRHQRLGLGAGLAGASVLVVNPTHAAAALRYRPGEDEAPVLLAAGRGEVARRLRREAERLGVPILQHVELARALQRAEPGQPIPEALYQAAAEVIRVVTAACGPAAPREIAP